MALKSKTFYIASYASLFVGAISGYHLGLNVSQMLDGFLGGSGISEFISSPFLSIIFSGVGAVSLGLLTPLFVSQKLGLVQMKIIKKDKQADRICVHDVIKASHNLIVHGHATTKHSSLDDLRKLSNSPLKPDIQTQVLQNLVLMTSHYGIKMLLNELKLPSLILLPMIDGYISYSLSYITRTSLCPPSSPLRSNPHKLGLLLQDDGWYNLYSLVGSISIERTDNPSEATITRAKNLP